MDALNVQRIVMNVQMQLHVSYVILDILQVAMVLARNAYRIVNIAKIQLLVKFVHLDIS